MQELLARLFPQPDVAFSIRRLPAPSSSSEPSPALAPAGPAVACATLTSAAAESSATRPLDAPGPAAPTPLRPIAPLPPRHRPSVTPLATDRYQITFTASAGTRDKLEFAQDLMRHAIPSGDTAAIFDSKDGRRCNARSFVQFHHVVPRAVGGRPTPANVQLRCRSHNDYEADLYYGPRQTDGVVRETRTPYRVVPTRQLGPDRVESRSLNCR